jgi:CDP-glycerol glycerophosphotransferase (TagB/SpsB family)
MKIDKSNPRHWFFLSLFGFNVCLVLLGRLFHRFSRGNKVILYGHKLNGNLKPIFEHPGFSRSDVDVHFLTMDPAYYRAIKEDKRVLFALNPRHMFKLVAAYAVVSSHGLHVMVLLKMLSNIRFVDVWHGIPYKGFDGDDFRLQHRYSEVWVTSRLLRQVYRDRFEFPEAVLHVTGYARTDVLINRDRSIDELKSVMGIKDHQKQIILFAPTWQQDDRHRTIYPFGTSEREFLPKLDALCAQHSALCILRTHLNMQTQVAGKYSNIFFQPYDAFPCAEEVLLVSDLLVCDWSSIAFDFLLLDRPTLFLEVPAPFKKGLSLDASYRFGAVIDNMDALICALGRYIEHPDEYLKDYFGSHQQVREKVYDDLADGHAADRCVNRLLAMRN